MKDIVKIKQHLETIFAKKYCQVDGIHLCPNGRKCSCSISAETQAYMRVVIPEPYYKYSILDFNGTDSIKNEELLDPYLALKVKEKIVNYCWKDITLDKLNHLNINELDQFSIISNRKKHGDNVIIYADNFSLEGQHKPKGKTMVASIIMKEAIKSRTLNDENYSQTYEWISFGQLENLLKQKDNESIAEIGNITSADWVVVDDIPYTKYSGRIVDPFFLERLSDNLPTILVFRYDPIKNYTEEGLGVAISRILSETKTTFIPLTK